MTSVPEVTMRHPWEVPPAPGEAIEVAEGVLWMRLPLPMTQGARRPVWGRSLLDPA